MSQPGISTMIAALEQDIGLTLFVRRGGRLQPTPEAKLFYIEAAKALESVENTKRIANEIGSGRRGYLAIAAYASISISLLPRVLSVFAEDRPDLQMKIISRNSQNVRELMSTQQFDIAIAELPLDYPTSHMEVFSYTCQCMLPIGHPLASKSILTPSDLDGVPFVTFFEVIRFINSSPRRSPNMAPIGMSRRRPSSFPRLVNWSPPAVVSGLLILSSAGPLRKT